MMPETFNFKFLVSLKDEISSLHSSVKKMLQILQTSFYEDKLKEEKCQLLKIISQSNEALQQDKKATI